MGTALERADCSDAQRRYIWVLAREVGLSSEDLHSVMEAITGTASIKELSKADGARLIEYMKLLCGQDDYTPKDMATRRQQEYIRDLSIMLGWDDDPNRLTMFLEARFGVSSPRFLTSKKASACIEALKSMVKGNRGERKNKK